MSLLRETVFILSLEGKKSCVQTIIFDIELAKNPYKELLIWNVSNLLL